MQAKTTTKNNLSQSRKTIREQKKELKRLGDSRQAAKAKCKDLNKTLKLRNLRLKETQESRNRWKRDCKEKQKQTESLKQFNRELESLLGLTKDELAKLRMQLATKKKSAEDNG